MLTLVVCHTKHGALEHLLAVDMCCRNNFLGEASDSNAKALGTRYIYVILMR